MDNFPSTTSDISLENRHPVDRPHKTNDAQQVSKRRALSTLATNVRVQPSRAAKPKVGTFATIKATESTHETQETSQISTDAALPTVQRFTIYHDELKGAASSTTALPPVQRFAVFQDDVQVVETSTTLSSFSTRLPETVTTLHRIKGYQRTALATLSCLPSQSPKVQADDVQEDSPMVLDTSQDSSFKESLHDKYVLQNCHYTREIYQCLRDTEQKFRPKPSYMRKQPDITHGMRSILVDWLVEVAEEYKLHLETLYLSVSYIDRFLSSMSVLRSKLQLVGTASMFIAAKYEEIYPPDLGEFVYITDDTYTKKQVLRMEQLILKVLSFDLAVPTIYGFLQFFCSVGDIPEIIEHLAQYLCELSLLEADPYLRFLPSHIAAAGLSLACHTMGNEPWSEELYIHTGFSLESFQDCLQCLYKSFCNASNYPQQAVREKYKASKFHGVSSISPPPTVPC